MTFTYSKIPGAEGFYSIIDDNTSKIVGEVRKMSDAWQVYPIQFPIDEAITSRREYSQKRTAVDALKAYYASEGVRVSLIY